MTRDEVRKALDGAMAVVDDVLPRELVPRLAADRTAMRQVAFGEVFRALLADSVGKPRPRRIPQAVSPLILESGQEWLKSRQVADLFGVGIGTVARLDGMGILAGRQFARGSHHLYPAERVKEILAMSLEERWRLFHPEVPGDLIARLHDEEGQGWPQIARQTGLGAVTLQKRYARWHSGQQDGSQ